jgi:hypothetical protein
VCREHELGRALEQGAQALDDLLARHGGAQPLPRDLEDRWPSSIA